MSNYTIRETYEFISTQTNDPIGVWKTCKVSGQPFPIYQSDLDFYEKISPTFNGKKYQIPTPTLCPEERQRRRLAFRNERKLYRRKSDFSGNEMISMYSPDKPYKVYSPEERRSDKRDPIQYGKEFDSQKPFFEQFDEIRKNVPRVALLQRNPENANYTNDSENNKNCYMCFTSRENENCLYVSNGFWSKNSIDCFWINTCERCYDSIQITNCYKVCSSFSCLDSSESLYLYECKNVNHSAFCVNLINKSYMFLNKQYTKEVYQTLLERVQSDKHFKDECMIAYQKLISTMPTNQWKTDKVESCF
jgi:hypothetical protein